jgi:transposase InsO family protein
LKPRRNRTGLPLQARIPNDRYSERSNQVRDLIRRMSRANPLWGAPRYLLRDRDGIYGQDFTGRVEHMGIKQVRTAPRSPWQNPFVERLIGTLRRDCIDHVIVLGDNHLRRILHDYLAHFHSCRTHLSPGKDAPEPRPVEPPDHGKVVEFPMVRGLHHRYSRRAA